MLTAEEEELKRIWDLHSCLESARRRGYEKGLAKGIALGLEKVRAKGEAIGLEKGEAIGLEKGEAIGLEKGEAIGLEKGVFQNKIENARKMKSKGFSVEDIADITGLSVDDIEKL